MTWKVICDENLEVMRGMADNSIDVIIQDPPGALAFMGKEWDSFGSRGLSAEMAAQQAEENGHGTRYGHSGKPAQPEPGEREHFVAFMEARYREQIRILKPGGHCISWGHSRTEHWTAWAAENAGFYRRDILAWFYGQGFPKSHNIAKAMQKADGVRPLEVLPATLGMANNPDWNALEHRHVMPEPTGEAADWVGWGTALKPAIEFWIWMQKPISERTIVKNIRRWGTGAINIKGCAIGDNAGWSYPNGPGGNREQAILSGLAPRTEPIKATGGRWPANVVLSHVDGACRMTGYKKVATGTAVRHNGGGDIFGGMGRPKMAGPEADFAHAGENGPETIEAWDCAPDCAVRILDEQSGEHASRFFYTAKPARSEKEAGLAFEPVIDDPAQAGLFALPDEPAATAGSQGLDTTGRTLVREDGTKTLAARFAAPARANDHPTVKPVELMRWLVRLFTPPKGVVLDPFAGSGTTGVAAVLEGFDVILIEKDPAHAAKCEARCRWAENPHGGA